MTWPALPDSTVVARVLDTTVVFGQRSGVLARVDESGAFVLAHRSLFADRRDAAGELTHVFSADAAEVEADLRALEEVLNELNIEEPSPISPVTGPRRDPPRSAREPTWTFDALGTVVEVRCHDAHLMAIIEPVLAAYRASSSPPDHRFDVWEEHGSITITQDGGVVHERADPGEALNSLTACITVAAIVAPRDTLVLHTAAVAEGEAAVVIGGGSGEGKSTTTVELMARGMTFLTDELIELDPASGAIHGLPRPIGLEGPAREWRPALRPPWAALEEDLQRWPVPPGALGAVGDRGQLHLFVDLDFSAAETTTVAVLDPLHALGRFCALTFNRDRLTSEVLAQLGELLSRVPSLGVRHDGARQAADAIADHWKRVVARR